MQQLDTAICIFSYLVGGLDSGDVGALGQIFREFDVHLRLREDRAVAVGRLDVNADSCEARVDSVTH